MSNVTQILSQVELGDREAADRLLQLVYDELRLLAAAKIARESPGQTLQATALVHEAYVRLVDQSQPQKWNSRGHFFAAAAEAMRRILVERARQKGTEKRGGMLERQDLELDAIYKLSRLQPLELLALHEALELLAEKSPRRAELAKIRYFLGCTVAESAQILGIAPKTAEEDWTYAKAWLQRQMKRS